MIATIAWVLPIVSAVVWLGMRSLVGLKRPAKHSC